MPADPAIRQRGALASGLVVLAFAYYWISLSPFQDLSTSVGPSAALAQLVGMALLVALLVCVGLQSNAALLLAPRGVVITLFVWLALVSLFAPDAATALRRLLMTFIVCIAASATLLLPRSEKAFARLLAIGLIAVLTLSYCGVFLVPARAIHQATDSIEPGLAGDWRGVFGHKNIAAPAMVIAVLCGLYLRVAWSKFGGAAIAILALLFLVQSGGKTALAMLPFTLVFVWLMQRFPRWRSFMVIGTLLAINLGTVGVAGLPALGTWLERLGIDATFTGRIDIWRLSLDAIMQRPFTGYGFSVFWQTGTAEQAANDAHNWASSAAHSHNGYVEALINGGLPALVLLLLWLVILPLRDIGETKGKATGLSLLYQRIWLFGIFTACLESIFLASGGPIWYALLIAVFGLHLQRVSVASPSTPSVERVS